MQLRLRDCEIKKGRVGNRTNRLCPWINVGSLNDCFRIFAPVACLRSRNDGEGQKGGSGKQISCVVFYVHV